MSEQQEQTDFERRSTARTPSRSSARSGEPRSRRVGRGRPASELLHELRI